MHVATSPPAREAGLAQSKCADQGGVARCQGRCVQAPSYTLPTLVEGYPGRCRIHGHGTVIAEKAHRYYQADVEEVIGRRATEYRRRARFPQPPGATARQPLGRPQSGIGHFCPRPQSDQYQGNHAESVSARTLQASSCRRGSWRAEHRHDGDPHCGGGPREAAQGDRGEPKEP